MFAAVYPTVHLGGWRCSDRYGGLVLASLSLGMAVAIDSAIWLVWSVMVGWWASKLPPERIDVDGWLTRVRPWEHNGHVYAPLGVRRWKRWLPDAGPFGRGRPKRLMRLRDADEWRALAAETRRAERVHWLVPLAFFADVAVHGGVILIPMGAYAFVTNAPCVIAQRHNRGRLEALLERRALSAVQT
jgi:glycosyl-4,4'-diaponeurosporenoate acyltransferase